MTALKKLAIVGGGYIAAFSIAAAAVVAHMVITGEDAQTSGGMYAFGDLLLFVAVLGGLSVAPTGAALFFLRPYRRFWTLLSACGLAVAAGSGAAAVLFAIGRHATSSPLATWASLSALGFVVAPLLALTFLVCALVAPHRAPRWALLAATVMEAALGAYGGWVLFASIFLPNS